MIIIGGSGDYWEDDLNIDKAFSSSDEGDCRILLAHNPDSVDTTYKTPLSLVLSGHTHGGQVVIPFTVNLDKFATIKVISRFSAAITLRIPVNF